MSRSDVAAQVIKQLQDDEAKLVEADFDADDEVVQEEKWSRYRFLQQKIKPEWKEEDKNALEQLKRASEATFNEIFEAAFDVLDGLYQGVRVPVTNHHDQVVLDGSGRIQWQRDESGNFIEDWETLNGQDIDVSLLKLQELKLIISQRVRELFLDAVFAKNILQDDYHDSYSSVLQGTNPLREAKASRDTREARWNYFFRYYIWSLADSFDQELVKTMALLSKIRNWRIQEKPNRWD